MLWGEEYSEFLICIYLWDTQRFRLGVFCEQRSAAVVGWVLGERKEEEGGGEDFMCGLEFGPGICRGASEWIPFGVSQCGYEQEYLKTSNQIHPA